MGCDLFWDLVDQTRWFNHSCDPNAEVFSKWDHEAKTIRAVGPGARGDDVAGHQVRRARAIAQRAKEMQQRVQGTVEHVRAGDGLRRVLKDHLDHPRRQVRIYLKQESGGARNNRTYLGENVRTGGNVPEPLQAVLYDPQTSGGLLIAIAPDRTRDLLERLAAEGVETRAVIGKVTAEHPCVAVLG